MTNDSLIDIKSGGELWHHGSCAIGWGQYTWGRIVNAGTFGVFEGHGSVNVPMTNTGLIDVNTYGQVNFYRLNQHRTLSGRGDPNSEIRLINTPGNVPYDLSSELGDHIQQRHYHCSTQVRGRYRVPIMQALPDVQGDTTLTFAPGASLQLGTSGYRLRQPVWSNHRMCIWVKT